MNVRDRKKKRYEASRKFRFYKYIVFKYMLKPLPENAIYRFIAIEFSKKREMCFKINYLGQSEFWCRDKLND